MSKPELRRQRRPRRQQGRLAPRWLLWTAGGLASAVVLVLIVLRVAGVFSGGEREGASANMPTPDGMAQLISTGQSIGPHEAPVTIG